MSEKGKGERKRGKEGEREGETYNNPQTPN